MTGAEPPTSPRLLVAVDALTYAAVATILTVGGTLFLGVATGGGLVRGNAFLFVAGFLFMGAGTVLLWPSTPEDLEPDNPDLAVEGDSVPKTPDQTPFQRLVVACPPLRWLPPPPPDMRLATGAKLMLTSVTVLALSYALETVVGVN